MDSSFRLFPESASTAAAHVDALYFFLVGVASFFTLLIFVLIFSFCIYYRRGAKVNRTFDESKHRALLEITWSLIPLGLTLVMFGWGAQLYFWNSRAPEDSIPIDVVGKQWMWKIQHQNGRQEINTLHVPVNRRVRLRMISEDVIHSFYIPNFRIKQDVLPGRYTSTWFEPTKIGEYHLFCAEYCGTSHANMRGKVVVQSQADHAQWLRESQDPAPAQTGAVLFERLRCHSCHGDQEQRGPVLAGLYGRQVPLAEGGTTTADDDYLRQSILDPRAKVVAGFSPLMPTYRDQVQEQEILALIDFIKTLGAPQQLAQQPNTEQDSDS